MGVGSLPARRAVRHGSRAARDGRDEQCARLDLDATALAGHVVIAAIIVMCLWEWGHGRDGAPYVQLGALAGVAYLAALALLRWRG